MSLLLDALKRAEQAKQGKPADSGLALDAVVPVLGEKAGSGSPATAPRTEPSLSQSGMALALEDDELSPMPAGPAPASRLDGPRAEAGVPPGNNERAAARNVFAAKAASETKRGTPGWLLPLAAVIVVAIGAGGWYVWTEVQRTLRPTGSLAQRPATPTPAPTPAPTTAPTPAPSPPAKPGPTFVAPAFPTAEPAAPASSTTSTATPVTPAPTSSPAAKALPGTTPPPVASTKAVPPMPERVASAKPSSGAKADERDTLLKNLQARAAATPKPGSAVELKLTRQVEPPKVSNDLALAYSALVAGNYTEAKRAYANIISGEPANLDANLGLATALARSGEAAAAQRAYRRALEIDPRNPTALAGLLVVSEGGNGLEVELKKLVSRQPESSALHFALGNMYSAQSRWTEAQQAYFEAYRFDSTNADILHNLAVSLDQLQQTRLALDYYQRALALAKPGAALDRALVTQRVAQLQSALANPR